MIAARFMEQLTTRYPDFLPLQLQNAYWLGYRLSELLPLELHEKQALLQITDPLDIKTPLLMEAAHNNCAKL